jgi:hypothetical protein
MAQPLGIGYESLRKWVKIQRRRRAAGTQKEGVPFRLTCKS